MTPFPLWTLMAAAAVLAHAALGGGRGASAQSLCDTPQCECDEAQTRVRCDCRRVPQESQKLVLKAQGPGHVPRVANNVDVAHCDQVRVSNMAFDGAETLFTVAIDSVGRLEMADEAFGWSENGGGGPGQQHHQHRGLTITITNVTTVPEVPSWTFRGRLHSITFDRVRIDAIRPFAFGSLTGTVSRIEFRDTVFGQVEQQAFKKFTVNEFVLKRCRFEHPVPSRTLTELTVHDELRLEDVVFSTIRGLAFRVHGPKVFRLQNSKADCVQSDAFEIRCRGPAFVEDNAFGRLERGAFAAITLDAHKVAESDYQEFVFENNTVTEFENDALVFNTNGFRPRVEWLIVGKECGCPARWLTDLVVLATNYPKNVQRPAWIVQQATWCAVPDDGTGRLIKAQQYDEEHCGGGANATGLGRFHFTGGVAVIAVIALTAALVYWVWYRKRKRIQWTNVPASSPLQKTRSILRGGRDDGDEDGGDNKHRQMVMPEGKTYRETELHVIVERTGNADCNHQSYRSTTNYRQQRHTEQLPLTSDL
ncbi:Pectin lyase fold [Cinara cedri]|uniref:Pectin lyase fold n=1 Tax=Cinara cedri TaxID=506608 RepID=A0A5E4ML50_9HEMI|nr:Pectin lyase fold [Cinara cedri]